MIPWLLNQFGSHPNLLLRSAGAAMLGLFMVLLLGPRVIRSLIRRKLGDRPEFDRADLNQLTKHKSNTPTMGGVLIVPAIFVSVLLFGDLRNMYIRFGLFMLVWFGVLGGIDDWLKLRRASGVGSRHGLVMWQKMIFQIGGAMMVALYIWSETPDRVDQIINPVHSLYVPLLSEPLRLTQFWYVVIAVLTIVGSSNAVNLTDGMDGLASGCMIIATVTFMILAIVVGGYVQGVFENLPPVRGGAEMAVVCAAMMGSCLGFLWYNANPAQVFMGDTGSLPLGALLGYAALVTRHELVLLIAGGVFAMEAISVVIQVGHFKYTRRKYGEGKRFFRCAPLHHHFHLGGWAESKVVTRFWILSIILAALALATLKLKIG